MLLAGSLKLHPYRLQSFCRMPLSTSDTIWTSGSVSKIGQLIGQLAKKTPPLSSSLFLLDVIDDCLLLVPIGRQNL